MAQYTDRKVHVPLALKLGVGRPTVLHTVRFSVEGHKGGIATQRAAHFGIYGADPDIAKVAALPEEAWDPDRPEVGARHGVTWITLADIHDSASGANPVAAVTFQGDAVFMSISMSSTIKHIKRADAEDLNGTTALVMAVLNHFPSLREACWADDVTRANRDNADWGLIVEKCRVREITMTFGGQRYNQKDHGAKLSLKVLGVVGGEDDPKRRRAMTGKRLLKYMTGGAALSEHQMPAGWGHKRDAHGRPVIEDAKGIVPEADSTMIPVMQELYSAYAGGESYQAIAHRMITLEAEGKLLRRDHRNLDNTYAAVADDEKGRHAAAKAFFVRLTSRPPTPPNEDQILRYLDGESPEDVFDADTRMYIAKIELVRTGRLFRRLKNDIRERGIVLNGVAAVYRDDLDEYGWFDVLSAPWPWPSEKPASSDAAAIIRERFGIHDQTCREAAARALRELQPKDTPTGGRAHRGLVRRAIQHVPNWVVDPGDATARYADEPTQWGIQARATTGGKTNFILLFRRASDGIGTRTQRNWTFVGSGERRVDHIAATGCLPDLCGSVATETDTAIRHLLDPRTIATLEAAPTVEYSIDPTAAWLARATALEGDLAELETDESGLRLMAARREAQGDRAGADKYDKEATQIAHQIDGLREEAQKLRRRVQAHRAAKDTAEEAYAEISIAAFLTAGLERAAQNNGMTTQRVGQLCDEHYSDWRFADAGEKLSWSAMLTLPLLGGGTARLQLRGTIDNVRPGANAGSIARDNVARRVLDEGTSVDDVADELGLTRHSVLTKRLTPWLVGNGIESAGARRALLDHPMGSVRQLVHGYITAPQESAIDTSAYANLVVATYFDPSMVWGRSAVPDDTSRIQDAVDLVIATEPVRGQGVRISQLATSLGITAREVWQLAIPNQRLSGGFVRPKYLAYANAAKDCLTALQCPHGSCVDAPVDHVVLLPEVATSGFGVLCRQCRRIPSTDSTWAATEFPLDYLRTPNKRPGSDRLAVNSHAD